MKNFLILTVLVIPLFGNNTCFINKIDIYASLSKSLLDKQNNNKFIKLDNIVLIKKGTKFCIVGNDFTNYKLKVKLSSDKSIYWINDNKDNFIEIDI